MGKTVPHNAIVHKMNLDEFPVNGCAEMARLHVLWTQLAQTEPESKKALMDEFDALPDAFSDEMMDEIMVSSPREQAVAGASKRILVCQNVHQTALEEFAAMVSGTIRLALAEKDGHVQTCMLQDLAEVADSLYS
jgi:hypothetical protein